MGGRNKLNSIVVVDLEATCQLNEEDWGRGERSDIIEIGACMLNLQSGKVTQKTSYIVKPRNSSISEFCTELTTITQEQVNRGIPFGDACNKLAKEFGTRNKLWASWGDYDRKHFYKDCEHYGARYPFGPRHLNAKTLFSLMNGLNREIGLRAALEYYDIEFKGTQHRGHDDAFNTAKVLWKTLGR